ncbi:MAG: hypothetical protein ISS93_01695 [Candidatus Aenigmarchaeota archaeon]|nr:hypothetical protein [Candidatus Aenigmarchaeota archaeon]
MKISPESVYILRKLYRWKRVGGVYINEHDVIRAFPRWKRDRKQFKRWIKELRKEGLILLHKNNTCISLNKHKLGEIESLI